MDWGTGDQPCIQRKTKGAGITQQEGYLALSSEECELATHIPRTSRVFLEYGCDKEGYSTGEKFIANVWDAAAITNYKYPSEQYTILWLFDQTSCHRAYGEDILNAGR